MTLNAVQKGELQVVHRNGLRLLKLVNTLLDFSRIEAGRVQATYQPTDLSKFTANLASVFRSAIERAGMQLIVSCPQLSELAYVDRDMWEKIVLNLLSNAFKFTFEGSITVSVASGEGAIELRVSDTGIGIAETDLPRLFERFHRVRGAKSRSHEGSGIGLALVRELVKLHGGSIDVESKPGKGTTFTISIPTGSSHLQPDRISAERTLSSTTVGVEAYVEEALRWLPGEIETEGGTDLVEPPAGEALLTADFSKKILLADDNADMRDYLRRILSRYWKVETVPDGNSALQAARERLPDLIVSDVMMPGMDGFELLHELRSDVYSREVPVILLSARAGEESRIEGLQAGADDYLTKPFSARELVARIAAHLEMVRVRHESIEAVRRSEERFRAFVTASSDVVYSMSPDWREMRYLQGQDFIPDTTDPSRSWLSKYIHPDDQPQVLAAIEKAIKTKSIFELEHRVIRVDGSLGWTFSRAIPLQNEQNEIIEWFGAASDVTERKQAEEALSETTAQLEAETAALAKLNDANSRLWCRSSLEEGLDEILAASIELLNADMGNIQILDVKRQVLTIAAQRGFKQDFLDFFREVTVADESACGRTLRSGKRVVIEDVETDEPYTPLRAAARAAGYRGVQTTPLIGRDGEPLGMLSTHFKSPHRPSEHDLRRLDLYASQAAGFIERCRIEEALREQAEVIETVNKLGQTLSAELDLQNLIQAITDASTDLTGARFGSFFYNVTDEQRGSYMLYTLSGVPREAFAHFPMPRNTDIFAPTFRGEGTVLIDDVKKDPRYGKSSPYYGMPPGHLPVVSYLAVPVVSRSGEVLGGLFFGHPEVGVFTERDARTVEGLAAQTAIAMDNARLFEAAKRARAEAEKAAAENEQLYVEAQRLGRLKDEFLATVSHELRTPLMSILGWSTMLRSGQFSGERANKALETIERNARAQAQIIEDLLDVSRIITGKLRIDVRPVDPGSFIDAAVEAVRPAAEAKGVRLQKILDTGVASVSGDPVRLQQVVWNLLSNAIKFTPRDGRVQIRLERVNSHIEIIVSDTGAGIEPEFLPYVFDRFRQADQATTRQYGGMGLGLAIVRHLVELHGGTVKAESQGKGQGSTFRVHLPVAPVYQIDAEGERVHPAAREELSSLQCDERLDGVRVLVVDDEADTRELLKIGLEQHGAEVSLAGSVHDALKVIEADTPDLLISDIGMPVKDGYELIRRVRSLPLEKSARLPAIALTAYARNEDRLKSLKAGYQMHISKPVDLAELVIVAAGLVQRGR